MQVAKVQPEPLLLDNVVSTKILCTCSFRVLYIKDQEWVTETFLGSYLFHLVIRVFELSKLYCISICSEITLSIV